MATWITIVRETNDGREVTGTFLYAFYKNADSYQLTEVKIYQDGMIDALRLVDFEGFKLQVLRGEIRTRLPEGASLSIYPLALLTATKVNTKEDLGDSHFFGVDESNFLVEVRDEIERLNGRPTTSELCQEAYKQWRRERTEVSLKGLRTAYEAIPAHRRVYVLGDQDRKDLPIRAAIYGGKEAENYQTWFRGNDGRADDGE